MGLLCVRLFHVHKFLAHGFTLQATKYSQEDSAKKLLGKLLVQSQQITDCPDEVARWSFPILASDVTK